MQRRDVVEAGQGVEEEIGFGRAGEPVGAACGIFSGVWVVKGFEGLVESGAAALNPRAAMCRRVCMPFGIRRPFTIRPARGAAKVLVIRGVPTPG